MAAEKLISAVDEWFDHFKADFVSCMNISELAPYLFEEGLLTNDEFERIAIVMEKNSSQTDRVEHIVSVLKRKGPQTVMKFTAAIARSVKETTPCDMGNKYLLDEVLMKAKVPVMTKLPDDPDVIKMCPKEEISIDDVITMIEMLKDKVKHLEEKLAAPRAPPTLQCKSYW